MSLPESPYTRAIADFTPICNLQKSTSSSLSDEYIETNDTLMSCETSTVCTDNQAVTPDSGYSETDDTIEQPQKKKPVKHRKNQPPDGNLLPPCRVCGEKASGLHYGANTCEPCKGFFRRSIVKIGKKKEEYRCMKNGTCKLGTGKRTMCSYCRYKKCLEVGMSQEAIKIGRYTYEKKTKDITEVKLLKQGELPLQPKTDEYTVDSQHVDELVETLIQIEENMSDDFRRSFQPDAFLERQLSIYERYMLKAEIFGSLGALPRNVYEEFHSTTGIDIDDRKRRMSFVANRMEHGIRNMITFARHIPGFCDLTTSDQLALLKAGYIEYFFLGSHTRINTELKVVACDSKVAIDAGVLGAHSSEIATIVDEKYLENIFEYAARMQKCRLTVEEVTLARGIVLMFGDRCSLKEPEKAEKIQLYLIDCLRQVAAKNHKNPSERLCQIFDKFVLLREITENCREVEKLKSQWPVMQDHPLVLELIDAESDQPRIDQSKQLFFCDVINHDLTN